MSTYLQFAVLGIGVGVVYVGLANALILTYRATGIINFAVGATAVWGGYVYALLRRDGELVLPIGSISFGEDPGVLIAITLSLLSAVLVALVIYYFAFKPVRRAPVLAQVVVSIATMLTMQALVIIRFGPDTVRVDDFLPDESVELWGAQAPVTYFYMAAIIIVLSAAVACYLRFTRSGVATRAAASNERAAILMGFTPSRLAAVAMVIATLLSATAVILTAPQGGLNPISYTLYVVPALAVMLVARMTSILIATGFGLTLGAVQSILTLLVTKDWWPDWAASGIDQVLPLLVVIIALLAYGNRLPARGSLQTMRLPDVDVPTLRPRRLIVAFGVAAAALALTGGEWRFSLTFSLIMMVLALSYVVITGYLGQISLAQVAFAGTAGFVLSKFGDSAGIPFPLVIVACALCSTLLGILVALPALRIRGAQLAIVTLAAALAIERFIFNNYAFTPEMGNNVNAPQLFGLDLGVREGTDVSQLPFSLMVLVVASLMVVMFIKVAAGDLGRAFLAVRANERAAASAGIDVRLTKLLGFALSAFLAGVAGCLVGYLHGQLSAASFTVLIGLQVLAVAYLGGITSWAGAAIAGALAPFGIIYAVFEHLWGTGDTYALIAGLLLIATAIVNPVGIAGATKHQAAWVRAQIGQRASGGAGAPTEQPDVGMGVVVGAGKGDDSRV